MTVTVSYAWASTGNFDPDLIAGDADLIGLSDGGFAGVGTTVGSSDAVIFNADGTRADGWTNAAGPFAALGQLSNGNIVVASHFESSVHYEIRDLAGGVVKASTDIGDPDSAFVDVAALTGGGFWIGSTKTLTLTNADIKINRFDNDGNSLGTITVDSSGADDHGVTLTALDGGGVAAAWERTVGASTQIWYAVYNATGGVVKAPALVDNVGTINRHVSATAMDGGGFAIAYEDNDWTNTIDVTLVTFSAAGQVLQGTNVSNPTQVSDGSNDLNPYLTRLSNGMLAVAYSNNAAANTNTVLRLIDPETGEVLATQTSVTGGQPLSDDVENPAIAGFGSGQIAVVHGNLTSGAADGETLELVRTTTGDSAANVITGDDFIDIINGAGGDDELDGAGGNDTLDGGDNNDTLTVTSGNDTATGGNGDDTIDFADDLTTADAAHGGTGTDTMLLDGDYTLTVTAAMMDGIEVIELASGHDYDLTFDDANVAGGATLTVDGSALGTGDTLVLDGSDETNGSLIFTGGSGNDTLTGGDEDDTLAGGNGTDSLGGGNGNDSLSGGGGTDTLNGGVGIDVLDGGAGNDTIDGGAGGDTFELSGGGNDTAQGGVSGGADTFDFGAAFNGNDTVDGGAGTDTIVLSGDYSGGVAFKATTMIDVEAVVLGAGFDYALTLNNGNIAAGDVLTVDASALGAGDSLTLDGTGESDGGLAVTGGAGADTILAGRQEDSLNGGGGDDVLGGGKDADALDGGSGADTFFYTKAKESHGAQHDTITGFDALGADRFDVSPAITGIDAAIATGALSQASFDGDLKAAVGHGLDVDHAVLFTADAGDLAGVTFLVVDLNSKAGYQAGRDLVVQLDGAANLASLDAADFI